MTRLIEILISFAIVIALMLIVGLVLPSSRHLSESVETNRKMTIVFDTINSLRRFKDWNPLVLRDPAAKLELSGPNAGVGAKLAFSSDVKQVGDGSWEIVESVPGKSVKYAIDDQRRGHDKFTEFKLTPTGRGAVKRNVEITQTYDVEYGWNLIGRYAGLYVSRHVGDDMKLGLARLSSMLATVPNVDYAVKGSKMRGMAEMERPAEDLLVVKAGSIERNNDKIKASMKSNMEWINRTMAANGLAAAGPMRIVSIELGRENYTFNVVVPVRRAGAAAAPAADEADAGQAGASAPADANAAPARAPVAAASGSPLAGLKLLGPVTYERVEPRRAATATYTGYMAELENVRNALRAWTLTQGEEVVGSFEVYKNGIDQAFTANGRYDVYWSIK